jgi:hypothetical protein
MPADVTAKARCNGVRGKVNHLQYESSTNLQLLIDALEAVNGSIQASDFAVLDLQLLF